MPSTVFGTQEAPFHPFSSCSTYPVSKRSSPAELCSIPGRWRAVSLWCACSSAFQCNLLHHPRTTASVSSGPDAPTVHKCNAHAWTFSILQDSSQAFLNLFRLSNKHERYKVGTDFRENWSQESSKPFSSFSPIAGRLFTEDGCRTDISQV